MHRTLVKQSVLRSLRRAGLLALADRINGSLMRFRTASDNRRFLRLMRHIPFPPPALMVDPYGDVSFRGYWESGRASSLAISEISNAHFAEGGTRSNIRVLDWGCGPARVVRHLGESLLNAQISACDCNSEAIAWAKASIDSVDFEVSNLVPPLPYADATFDLVYGISIFTHLSEDLHYEWIRELRRVIRRGGIILLTFQSGTFREKLLPDEISRFDRGELVTRGGVVEGSRMYCAFHPHDFLKRLFDQTFDEFLILATDQSIAFPQTTVMAKVQR